MAEAELQRRAEKRARELEKIEAAHDAKRGSAATPPVAAENAPTATAGVPAEPTSAPEPTTAATPASVVTVRHIGPDATIRTAAVFKAVVPVAIRALVQELGKVRRPREEAAAV